MKSETYPLAMPADLLAKMRDAAKRSNLSIAEVMRQSMSLGLPSLLKQTPQPPSNHSQQKNADWPIVNPIPNLMPWSTIALH
jgi:hypothetical protein